MNFTQHFFQNQDENIAYISNDKAISYGYLKKSTKKAIDYLENHGIGHNDIVMIVLDDSYWFSALVLGCFAIGAKPFWPSPSYTVENLQSLIHSTKTKHIFCSKSHREKIKKLCDINVHYIEELENHKGLKTDILFHNHGADETAMFLNTTGSMGMPKLIPHTMDTITKWTEIFNSAMDIQQKDVIYCGPKICFTYGFGISLLSTLYVGATAILHSETATPKKIEQVFKAYRPTYFFIVPTIAYLMNLKKIDIDLSSVKKIVSGGDYLNNDTAQKFEKMYQRRICAMIGQSENFHFYLYNDESDSGVGTIGKPLPGVEIKIDHSVSDLDQIGELCVKSPFGGKSYFLDDTNTNTFENGWVRTRDLARITAQNYVVYCGRVDNLTKINGQYVSPIEIENRLMDHPDIENCVITVENSTGNKILVANIVSPKKISNLDIRQFLKDKIENYKIPKKTKQVDSLPTTWNGKKIRPKTDFML